MSSTIETPSGKWSKDENFPVGSWLLPARLRPHVADFYALARTTDDIADNPNLTPQQKLERLDGFDAALRGEIKDDPAYEKSFRCRASLAACGVTIGHSRDLIAAFKQDATKLRYADWYDLMGYCNLSAAPVGRFLLDLHGEDSAGYAASDPLCNALQVLNHLQDCKDDYLALDRVYLPGDWMAENGVAVEDLARDRASPGIRAVLDAALAGVDDLMQTARTLPGRLRNRRLAMESAVIVRLADRLSGLLASGDPIGKRVALGKSDFIRCGVTGIAHAWLGRRWMT
jgi:squalene synthase HpnC